MNEHLMLWVGKVFARIDELKSREDGQALVEYGLILALVSVACILALTTLGNNIAGKIGDVATAIAGA
jgi:pilus assembly protein Flp/PilA